ncbi:hypothetical protein N7486_005693 [Penicillium sp. IBT 16267x]|nr:hypothetical protein N7486_005693 [Penicillium sp. IBT 16267x]
MLLNTPKVETGVKSTSPTALTPMPLPQEDGPTSDTRGHDLIAYEGTRWMDATALPWESWVPVLYRNYLNHLAFLSKADMNEM